ncbi:hypothetical protein [Caulobacter mirabilis]|uniref:Uncharacterized protein n=1 Tax=Caulobacter mirabilis TaxID=69666 RepID=A0A2D2ASX6_9CAUL|nr:hypothetical protein [Caulobacter mirabilis]ATQ41118.1 hypothetical protein CSW64_01190 [Caulobacter mirabilis]
MTRADDRAPSARLKRWAPAVGLAVSAHVALLLTLAAVTPRGPAVTAYPETPIAAIVLPPPPPPPEPPPAPKPAETASKAPDKPAAAAPRKAPPATPKPAAKRPSPAKPVVQPRVAKTSPPPDVEPLPAPGGAIGEPSVLLGDAALAGALVAGAGQGAGGGDGAGGGGGGRCDMVERLQEALRGDREVRAAVTQAHRSLSAGGKAILVWNGEWMRNPGQDGKGLAGVRQAIAMEVAFAPAACRTQPMRGLVLITFADAPGSPRLALGSERWRWNDLLAARR